MHPIFQHRFDHGLVLLAEPVGGAQSLAMSLLTPAGLAAEPEGRSGAAAMLSEMMCRGAGELDARAHSDALDQLGVQRGTAAESLHLHLGATMIGSKVREALPLLLDMVRRPRLPESAMEPSRDLCLQSIDALEDEPQQKVFIELRQRHYPHPFARSPLGTREGLASLTLGELREFWRGGCVPGNSVIGFAGRFDWDELKGLVGDLTAGWRGSRPDPVPREDPPRVYHHETAETAQVHIGLAYDAPVETDPRSNLQRAAAAALSGGMSGRLFTEVREKRGLCYSVYAAYAAGKYHGAMLGYAGTTAARAQETLDVMIAELRRLREGIEPDEFARAIVGMKSRLVMSGESTAARAHAIAADQTIFGRPRTLAELGAEVDAIRLDAVNDYLRSNPPGPMTIVTIGPGALEVQGSTFKVQS